jgi:hypothetical protein
MVKGTKLVLAASELLTLAWCCPASAAAPAAALAAAAPGMKLPLTRVRALRVLALAGLCPCEPVLAADSSASKP